MCLCSINKWVFSSPYVFVSIQFSSIFLPPPLCRKSRHFLECTLGGISTRFHPFIHPFIHLHSVPFGWCFLFLVFFFLRRASVSSSNLFGIFRLSSFFFAWTTRQICFLFFSSIFHNKRENKGKKWGRLWRRKIRWQGNVPTAKKCLFMRSNMRFLLYFWSWEFFFFSLLAWFGKGTGVPGLSS